jgi:glycosyltransferase domain-containing protein
MNKSLLENITIVIPTYKRYSYLLRILKFYKNNQKNIRILILDSTPYNPSNKELIQLISADNVIWKKYDSSTTFWDKIGKGSKYIQTGYVTLCADDDFINPSAIADCIEFLSNNSDYSSAHGLYFSHKSSDNVSAFSFTLYPLYQEGRSAFEETGIERVQAYLSGKTGYYPLYAVHRLETFLLIWSETSHFISDWNLHELFPCCLSFVYGKMKILPVFYASRESNSLAVNNYELFQRTFSHDKVSNAVEGIAKHLNKVDDQPLIETERLVRGCFGTYLDRAENKYYNIKSENKNDFIKHLKQIKHKLRIRTRAFGLINRLLYQGCHPSIHPKYLEEYKRVRESVISSGLTAEDLNESRKDFENQ